MRYFYNQVDESCLYPQWQKKRYLFEMRVHIGYICIEILHYGINLGISRNGGEELFYYTKISNMPKTGNLKKIIIITKTQKNQPATVETKQCLQHF